MRLRDLPGLVRTLEKVYDQARGYIGRIPGKKEEGSPYSAARKKRKKLKWE